MAQDWGGRSGSTPRVAGEEHDPTRQERVVEHGVLRVVQAFVQSFPLRNHGTGMSIWVRIIWLDLNI